MAIAPSDSSQRLALHADEDQQRTCHARAAVHHGIAGSVGDASWTGVYKPVRCRIAAGGDGA